jgi:ABC-type nitrate/sulfonate/bicarbonate transport system permease component
MHFRTTGSRLRRTLEQCGLLLVIALAWQLFAFSDLGRKSDVPPFTVAAGQLLHQLTDPGFWGALGSTLLSTVIGLCIAIAIGVPLGLLIGLNRKAALSANGLIDFLRFLPAVAFLPLTLLLFGATRTMVVTIVVISAVWPLLVQSIYATQQSDAVLGQVSKAFRMKKTEVFRFIYFPSALPFLFTGLRVSASIALLLSISAEFLGGSPGLGMRLSEALISNRSDIVFALVLISGGLGLGLNELLRVSRKRVLWWHPSEKVGS